MPPKFNFTKDETVNAAAFAAAGGGRFCIKLSSSKLLPQNPCGLRPQGGG